MPRRGMFFRADGSNILEPEGPILWVTVHFSMASGRFRPTSSESMMRLVAERCRSGDATISLRPLHHDQPCCLSLPVGRGPRREHILGYAADVADWHWLEIVASREWVDIDRILAYQPWWVGVA
ncbi:uncharacterized protein N7515_001492 [Penicillium bovifimosum]|uniref:Uncharacterized protein n=1 Tax=Penicillium bovifimosum TaxID=126998 RepID=A0A9W9HAB0_9EURO|nr:uncharacterized protein N7515_001492 [Penicillium bovifimosum]KAJ5142705.1 hypothetical protein N7515_001492 [Penicillium bovifimosum]